LPPSPSSARTALHESGRSDFESRSTVVPLGVYAEVDCAGQKGKKLSLETRSTDAEGRVSLPKAFANATVIIEQLSENELCIRKASVIPEDDLRLPEEVPIVLSDRERERFLRALDHPPKPNAALRRLMAGKARKRG
jgi:hypothetical protein